MLKKGAYRVVKQGNCRKLLGIIYPSMWFDFWVFLELVKKTVSEKDYYNLWKLDHLWSSSGDWFWCLLSTFIGIDPSW